MVISPALCRNHLKGTRISLSKCTVDIACDNHWRAMLIKTKGHFFRKRDWIRPNTIQCSAYFDLYHMNIYMYWLYHFKWLYKPVSRGITWCYTRPQAIFRQNPIWRLAAILNLLITEPSNQNTNVTIVLSMVEDPHLDILHGHSNRFIRYRLICPNSTQNWAFGPLYRAKWPPWGYFCTW